MNENFPAALLLVGGTGLALHYEKLSSLYDGVPLVMAYGLPVSGKSLSVQIAMSIIGKMTSIGGKVNTVQYTIEKHAVAYNVD